MRFLSTLLLSFLVITGCNTTSSNDPQPHYYEFSADNNSTGDDNFIVKTSDPQVIATAEAQLSLPQDERNLHINGEIARGNGGYNTGWSWHFVPEAWGFAEVSIEVCDGQPGFVEKNLDYWVDDVGRFCPWSSFVLREVEVN